MKWSGSAGEDADLHLGSHPQLLILVSRACAQLKWPTQSEVSTQNVQSGAERTLKWALGQNLWPGSADLVPEAWAGKEREWAMCAGGWFFWATSPRTSAASLFSPALSPRLPTPPGLCDFTYNWDPLPFPALTLPLAVGLFKIGFGWEKQEHQRVA